MKVRSLPPCWKLEINTWSPIARERLGTWRPLPPSSHLCNGTSTSMVPFLGQPCPPARLRPLKEEDRAGGGAPMACPPSQPAGGRRGGRGPPLLRQASPQRLVSAGLFQTIAQFPLVFVVQSQTSLRGRGEKEQFAWHKIQSIERVLARRFHF